MIYSYMIMANSVIWIVLILYLKLKIKTIKIETENMRDDVLETYDAIMKKRL